MATETNTRIVLAARPQGRPKPSDFRIESVGIAEPGEGELLLQIPYLSLDPYMRGRMNAAKSYAKPVEIDGVMEGGTVARVANWPISRVDGPPSDGARRSTAPAMCRQRPTADRRRRR